MRTEPTTRRGFVLATSLLVMTLLTVMLAAAFIMISAEYRTTNGAYSTTRSLAIAQAGLQRYFAEGHFLGGGSDSLNYTFSGGYARVVARRLRDTTATRRALWAVVSTGVDSTRSMGQQGQGQRVVAQLARLDPGTLPARSAMTAANGVIIEGPFGPGSQSPISGRNTGFTPSTYNPYCRAPSSPAGAADTFGLTAPAGQIVAGGGDTAVAGEGANHTSLLASPAAVIDSTRIAWSRLLNGEFTPDYISQFPPAGNNTYRSHYFPGDVTIPAGSRRGLLVATGDVTLSSGTHWDGVIVAGGRLDALGNSSYIVHGMVITGLNISLGQNVPANRVKRGWSRTIQWDWCYTRSATNSIASLVPVRGSFVDSWATY